MAHILIVDDEESIRDILQIFEGVFGTDRKATLSQAIKEILSLR